MNPDEKKEIAEQSSDEEDRIIRQFDVSFQIEDYSYQGKSLQKSKFYLSQYKQRYESQMQKVEKLTLQMIGQKYCQNFISHKIEFNPNRFSKQIAINRIDSTINSQIAIYQVNVSYFQMNISLLNLDLAFTHEHAIQLIGGGSYGNVYLIEVYGKKYASKNVLFQESQSFTGNQQQQVYSTLVEYCISKICSALQVGVNIEPVLGFDLICYSNCVQFFMQYCHPIRHISQQSKQKLLSHLSIMHMIQLVHNDIKPQNIMYSPSFKQNVFIDFGISSFIQQALGLMTKVTFKGSYNYTLNEMKSLFNQKLSGYVDLYFNDLNALSITFKQLQSLQNINFQHRLDSKKAFKHSSNNQLQKYALSRVQQKRSPKDMNFIVNLVLTVFCLYTQKPYKQHTLQKIQKHIDSVETFYINLAQIITQIPPNSFIYEYFKKLIRPLLIQKNMREHLLFSIYKENHFIPWLKEDEKKEKKFQSRLSAVEGLLNYHLIILSKPASIQKFLQGFSLKLSWPQKASYFICYVDFMNRNCTKGKQYLVSLMYDLIYSNPTQKDKMNKKINSNNFSLPGQQNLLSIDQKHYQILCFIQKEFPKSQILHPEDLSLATKLLELFQKISDYQKTLSLYNLFIEQPLSKQHQAQHFKFTFDIFAMLQKNPQPRYIPEMKKKLQQMYLIRRRIKKQDKRHTRYNLFFTKILIKISQFFMEASQFSTINNKLIKIKLLEDKIKQIQTQFEIEGLTQNSIESKIVLHKIYEAKFVLSYLKSDYYQVIKYGKLLIEVNNVIQNPGPNKFMSKNIENIMAQVYLQLGDIQNSKKFLYYDLFLQVGQNYYSSFTNLFVRFKINILQNNLSKAKQNLQHLRLICNDSNKQMNLVNNLLTFDLKFCDSLPSKEIQSFIQTQLHKQFVKIQEWPLKMQENVEAFKILMTFQKWPSTNKQQLSIRLIQYRRIVAKVIQQKIEQQNLYNQQCKAEIQKGLDQFFENLDYLAYYPTSAILSQAPQLFMTIHLKYYQLFQSNQLIQKIYQISTQLYPFNQNLISLQLWINYYRFLINNNKIQKVQNLTQNLKLILDFIFLTHRELPFVKKRWYDLFFLYDSKTNHQQHKFYLTLHLLTLLTLYIKTSANPYFLNMFHYISKFFFTQITSKQDLNLLLTKMLKYQNNLLRYQNFLSFYILSTKKFSSILKKTQNNMTIFLFKFLKTVQNFQQKVEFFFNKIFSNSFNKDSFFQQKTQQKIQIHRKQKFQTHNFLLFNLALNKSIFIKNIQKIHIQKLIQKKLNIKISFLIVRISQQDFHRNIRAKLLLLCNQRHKNTQKISLIIIDMMLIFFLFLFLLIFIDLKQFTLNKI